MCEKERERERERVCKRQIEMSKADYQNISQKKLVRCESQTCKNFSFQFFYIFDYILICVIFTDCNIVLVSVEKYYTLGLSICFMLKTVLKLFVHPKKTLKTQIRNYEKKIPIELATWSRASCQNRVIILPSPISLSLPPSLTHSLSPSLTHSLNLSLSHSLSLTHTHTHT